MATAATGGMDPAPEPMTAQASMDIVVTEARNKFKEVSDMMDVMKQDMQEMERKRELEGMQYTADRLKLEALISELKLELEKMKHKEAEQQEQGKDKKDHGNDIKGFDAKHAPKPEKYDMDPKGYQAWHDLFTANMTSQDSKWEAILAMIEAYGKSPIKQVQEEEIKEKLQASDELMKKVKKQLYLNLIQYTTGDAYAKVMGSGSSQSLDCYRHIIYKGKNATIINMMEKRMRVMNPQKASTMADIESMMTAWKADIRYLREASPDDQQMLDNAHQMITIMIQIMPETVADYLIQKYDKDETTFDQMQQHLDDYLLKVDCKANGKKGNLKQMGNAKDHEDNEAGEEEDWQYRQDSTYGSYWVCTAIPAAKRQRPEEAAEDDPANMGKGKAKGKGNLQRKGQGPPGGCHECGQDHFVRDCEVRKIKLQAERALKGAGYGQKGKGDAKGKGKDGKANAYSSIPPRYWSTYNPGFMKGQWNQWRPSGYGQNNAFKGKGKGEHLGNMAQTDMKFTF